MYRDKSYFKEFLSDLTDIEKEGLKEVLKDLNLLAEDLSKDLEELKREVEMAEDRIFDLENLVDKRDLKIEELEESIKARG